MFTYLLGQDQASYDIPSVWFESTTAGSTNGADCGDLTYRLVAYYGENEETYDPAPETIFTLTDNSGYSMISVSSSETSDAGYYLVYLFASSPLYADAYLELPVLSIYIGNECEVYSTQFYPWTPRAKL